MFKKMMFAILIGACGANANAAVELMTGHVTLVEATYMPTQVSFIMDVGSPSCPAGTYLAWKNTNTDNNKAVYASLLTAIATGKTIDFYVNAGDKTCAGVYVHVRSNT